MFRAASLISYLLLALSVTGSLGSPAASAQPGVVSLHLKSPVSIAAKAKRDVARRVAHRAASRGSEGSLEKRQSPTTIGLGNLLTGFAAGVGIGSPVYEYSLLIDTSHPNTWVGADQQFTRTVTTVNQGTHETVTYTNRGSYTGYELTDTVTLSTTDVVTGQRIDDALTSSGFEGIDGVLGLAPGTGALPTVLDNLYSQGKISTKEFGLGLLPSWSTSDETYYSVTSGGELTFGGVDSSQYTGTLDYTSRVPDTPPADSWAVTTSLSYGASDVDTNVWTAIDSLTPYIYLPNGVYSYFLTSSGAVYDSTTTLLKLPVSAGGNLQNIQIQWGTGGTYTLSPDAQIWPTWANAEIGGDSDHLYLLVQNGGDLAKLGIPFLQRFYVAFDVDTSKVGIAPTPYGKQATISWPLPAQPGCGCSVNGSVDDCPEMYQCGNYIPGTGNGNCVEMGPVGYAEECYDGHYHLGPCLEGLTCTEATPYLWICL